MPRPIHFEIHAAEPARAIAFYEKVFGWSFKKWDAAAWEYWVISTGPAGTPGIDGGLIKRMGPAPATGQPVNAFVCTLGVDALDATLAAALGAGATVALPKMPVPGVGWLAYIHDTEGNILGLMQNDLGAK
jgi:uncharacterized protein